MTLAVLPPPDDDGVLDFLRETVADVEAKAAGGAVPIAVVVLTLERGNTYSVHQRGSKEAGTLAIVGMLDVVRQKIVGRHLAED